MTLHRRAQPPREGIDSVGPDERTKINLRLYLAGSSPNSQRARANLEAVLVLLVGGCDFDVEYIDVLTETKRCAADGIVITPTLIAIGAKGRMVILGDLSDSGKLHVFLKSGAALA